MRQRHACSRSRAAALDVARIFALLATMLALGCNSVFGIHEGTPRPMCADPTGLLIDDLEDGDAFICKLGGRNGGWYVFGDGTTGAELSPADLLFNPTRIPEGGRGTSLYAARFSGSGFAKWGAKMGLNLSLKGGTAVQPTDVSGVAGGIVFWMKSNVPVSVEFPTLETTQLRDGGNCVDSATQTNCDNHFFFQVTAPAAGWMRYEVPFNALAQRPGGGATWNPHSLMNIQFGVPAGTAFEVWVDDISFYSCGGPECQPTCSDPAFPVSCRANDGPRSSCRPPGTDCAAVSTWCADPLLIDDMEDGDRVICESGGRHGVWYSVSDDTSTDLTPPAEEDFVQTPIPGGRGTSRYAARVMGSGFKEWGGGMGIAFSSNGNQPYDASAADGISFWAKSDTAVYVSLVMPETTSSSLNGVCADTATAINCDNPMLFVLTAPSHDWVQYKLPFAAFNQAGGSVKWNPAHLTDIDFSPPFPADAFDIWVDDLRFYNCSLDDCTPTCPDPALPVPCPARGAVPAGCRPAGTDCDAVVIGCGPSNTVAAPADGRIAVFTGADPAADIPGRIFTSGLPAPVVTTAGALHIAVNAAPTPDRRGVKVIDHFDSCVDATRFTGVRLTIGGTVSGCALRFAVEDSAHVFDDGLPMSAGSHGTGAPSFFSANALLSGELTPEPQTVTVPFADVGGGFPATPFDRAKITGVEWVFVIEPSSAGGPSACVADVTVNDVRFY